MMTRLQGVPVILLLLFLGEILYTPTEAAKGGAKSAMRGGRGKSTDSVRRGQGAGDRDDEIDHGGEGDRSVPYKDRPCVGLCYYRKLKGIKFDIQAYEERRKKKPCIGLCHLNKVALAKGLPGIRWRNPREEEEEENENEEDEGEGEEGEQEEMS